MEVAGLLARQLDVQLAAAAAVAAAIAAAVTTAIMLDAATTEHHACVRSWTVLTPMVCPCMCRKSIQKGGPGFGYGFVCAFCFTLAFFCLLCGLMLDGFKDTVQDQLEVKRESWAGQPGHTAMRVGHIQQTKINCPDDLPPYLMPCQSQEHSHMLAWRMVAMCQTCLGSVQ